ncbi:phosphonate C-P lyase system protein PhnG [Pseudonocardia sp. MH-G8]|uniref:phosphonate C-P lyase system protein PhnG n=1 Tax=Pseudonocardia sp. MH-G8 TaxID=1854588 RepID=UPI000B9FC59F|nr:phosphonate C-P lyase system protein PhnG [Pseudonocardia sp. MH-G8]OZM76156.1 phosphonate metabolism protein PhnG [Pseudonocardia sp. MH-G8]
MEFSREDTAALLAVASREELVGVADACLADGVTPRVLRAPEVGCVATQVVEPVAGERFLLGDVLAVQAEVELAGGRGWSMRLGDDRAAVLAAAICDAEVQAGRPRADDVLALCARVAAREAATADDEWALLAPTVVEFEELT